MQQAAALLFGRVVVITLIAVAFIGLIASRLRRHLRVVPDQANRAPFLWLVSLTADARLHRRLRSIASETRQVAKGGPRHAGRVRPSHAQVLARDIEREIVVVDERLVAAVALDFDVQRRTIKELRSEADRIDDLVDRVGKLVKLEGSDPSVTAHADGLAELDARLKRLEEARNVAKVIDVAGRANAVVTAELGTVAAELEAPRATIPAQLVDSHDD